MTRKKRRQDELIDELLAGVDDPKEILSENGLVKQLTQRLVERALSAELTGHLGYEPYETKGRGTGNSCNGKNKKGVKIAKGEIEIAVPRDREGTFEPQLVKKRQRRLEGFDEKVLALYSRGLSTREIKGQLEELYGVEVSPTLIITLKPGQYDEMPGC